MRDEIVAYGALTGIFATLVAIVSIILERPGEQLGAWVVFVYAVYPALAIAVGALRGHARTSVVSDALFCLVFLLAIIVCSVVSFGYAASFGREGNFVMFPYLFVLATFYAIANIAVRMGRKRSEGGIRNE